MKLTFISLGFTILTFFNCTTSKSILSAEGDITDAVRIAVVDFLQSRKGVAKIDSVFTVNVENINANIVGIGISVDKDKVSVFTKNEVDYDYRFFPTRFYEYQNKLFYWKDSTINISNEIVKKLYRMNRVDTTVHQKLFPQRTIDERQIVVHYYFCKKDLTQYKKKITSIANRKYGIPKIEC